MTDELKQSMKEYAKALRRLENMAILIQETAETLRDRLALMSYRMGHDAGAHCTKCGDAIQGEEDSRCGNCV